MNIFEFGKEVKVNQLSESFIKPLLPHLALFYLGQNRKSPIIQENLKHPTDIQVQALDKIKEMAFQGISLLANQKVEEFGKLMDGAWKQKKLSNGEVSNRFIDEVYNKVKSLGAWGFKVCGAGGGGHFIVICPVEKRDNIVKSMEKEGVKEVNFSIDWTGLDVRRV